MNPEEEEIDCALCATKIRLKDSYSPADEAICAECDTEVTGRQHPTPRAKRKPRGWWKVGLPKGIAACFDDPSHGDRYTVLMDADRTRGGWCASYLGFNEQPEHPQFGVSQWGDFTEEAFKRFSQENNRYRIPWADIPEHLQKHVLRRMEPMDIL